MFMYESVCASVKETPDGMTDGDVTWQGRWGSEESLLKQSFTLQSGSSHCACPSSIHSRCTLRLKSWPYHTLHTQYTVRPPSYTLPLTCHEKKCIPVCSYSVNNEALRRSAYYSFIYRTRFELLLLSSTIEPNLRFHRTQISTLKPLLVQLSRASQVITAIWISTIGYWLLHL